jgi:hypothetical protein
MPSIESQAAEAAYLILINPECERQAQERPELIGFWMESLVPGVTPEQVAVAFETAAELSAADCAEMLEEFRRGTLVLPDSVFK